MNVPLLSMSEIDKRFGGQPALTAASLEVLPGEVMGLVGQNGAGKSTMIKILNGAVSRDSGNIAFDGKPWIVSSPQEAQSKGVSTIFQEINLIPLRSVAENISLGREPTRRFGRIDWAKLNRTAADLLEKFNVHIDVTLPLGDFPTAIQQMVAIARAVSFDAKLVIMDEPTSSLDEAEVAVLMRTVRQLKEVGVAVVFVTHKLDELYDICDRVTVMRDGRTVAVKSMQGIGKLELVATMLGRDLSDVKKHGATAFDHGARKVGDEVLSVRNLSTGTRLTDVSLDARRGEIVGLAGLLGSGRTETARAIFAADPIKGGDIKFNRSDVALKSPHDAIAAGMGFCSEDRKAEGIIPDMSVADNLTLALMQSFARSGVVNESRQKEIVQRFIKSIGIKCSSPDQKIRELSGGNQQKVLLARWLATNPKLLILDEPTRGIDVGAKAEIQSLIRKAADEGLCVLMISSEIEEVMEGADRVFVLREGKTVAELKREDINETAVMTAMAHGAGAGDARA
jgi:galactofuranose transport system ATP-binding protein